MKTTDFVKFTNLVSKWQINDGQLQQMLIVEEIPIFEIPAWNPSQVLSTNEANEKMAAFRRNTEGYDHILLRRSDVDALEEKHPELLPSQNLRAKDARELGRLKISESKTGTYIEAAVVAGLYAGSCKARITKEELWKALEKKGYRDIPDNEIFRKIWKMIPQEKRSTGGRPKKKP